MLMKTFAVMAGKVVINIVIADSKEAAEDVTSQLCIEYTPENPAGIGWTYNGSTFERPTE